jgi:hypothetical protein
VPCVTSEEVFKSINRIVELSSIVMARKNGGIKRWEHLKALGPAQIFGLARLKQNI